MMTKNAYFAGGCFWCIAPAFSSAEGVRNVTAGYSGGEEERPAYEEVKAQKTGHRETVRVEYDPSAVSYGELLDLFLGQVDLFDGEGQFIDRGHSYTLAVYPENGSEREIAEKKIRALEERAGKKVFVSVEDFKSFWTAEEEHQDYYLKHPEEYQRELEISGRTTPPSGGNADRRK